MFGERERRGGDLNDVHSSQFWLSIKRNKKRTVIAKAKASGLPKVLGRRKEAINTPR